MSSSKNNGSNGTTPALEVSKLHELPSEQQDLYLLTFTADLVSYTQGRTPEQITAEQALLKKEILQIVSLLSPAPTRVIRSNLSHCFADIFTKGDRRLLFESINDLLGILNGGKGEKDLKAKHAATACLGEIFRSAGDSAISLVTVSCSTLLKLLKQAQNHVGLRASIYSALGKVFRMLGGSADESIARDVWKSARNAAASDKAFLVQAAALRCLEDLATSTTYFDTSSDYDNLKSTVFKAIESPSKRVKHAAASSLAASLVKLFTEEEPSRDTIPQLRKIKKTSTRDSIAPTDDEEVPRPGSPAPKKPSVRLSFALPDLLAQLSRHYTRHNTSNRARAGLAVCYVRILQRLGQTTVEKFYGRIVDHLFVDLLNNPIITGHRYRLLITRKYIKVILDDIVNQQLLSQSNQLNGAKLLIGNYIKNYPQVLKETPEPTKHTLTAALGSLASLVRSLGSATHDIVESAREGLLQVLPHPSYTVQIAAAHCLQAFVLACPPQLLCCASICMNSLNRELGQLSGPRHSSKRCLGYAHGLAALLSQAPQRPLYGSLDINSRALTMATGLLKASSNSELRLSSTQIQVAWILIGALLSLGPNFVKIHLSQFLLLWKNALPPPLTSENSEQRSHLELSFLTHVRECALGSILVFLQYNSRLLTADVSKRIASMLQNTLQFINSLPQKKTTEEYSQRLLPALQLYDLDLMLKRRVLQGYTKLVNVGLSAGAENLLPSNLLTLAVSFFADPDTYYPNSLSSSIANSAANFEGIWELGDNYGFGVTGLIRGFKVDKYASVHSGNMETHWLASSTPNEQIDETLLSPIGGAREYDSLVLCMNAFRDPDRLPDPPATEVVNAAIQLFAASLPLQPSKIQESILEQMATFLSSPALQRDPGRKTALTTNIALAILSALQVASGETSSPTGEIRGNSVGKIIEELLEGFITHPDRYVRNISYEAFGRLCSRLGHNFTSNYINHLVDTIVSNRDPSARAGCAVALGCVHAQVGGMAAGFHLKSIIEVLMSLCNDPHPIVHFWALEGLTRVTDSAGLTFSGYVSGALGLLSRLYVLDSHNEEVSSVASSNLDFESPTPVALAKGLESLINVLGPDLQDMSKARDLIMTLVKQFHFEESVLSQAVGIQALEHLSMYASGHVDFSSYVRRLQENIASSHPSLKRAAIDGIFNLMKRDAEDVIAVAGADLEERLWLVLDEDPSNTVVRRLLRNWMLQTGLSDTTKWITRLQTILNKAKLRPDNVAETPAKSAGGPDLQDEEVAGFAAATGETGENSGAALAVGQEPVRWQVRSFAMDCLDDLIAMIDEDALASTEATPAEEVLQQRIADIVRMAFSASTANVLELRLAGLRVIGKILKMFGKTPDPDFAEAFLLEQYQAQIGSALTPAFAADSSPELVSEAVHVCATFIAAGIVTDVDRMGRILKLLVSALESFSRDNEAPSIGDLKGLSYNAQVMVKMAVFSAWAQLQVASVEQVYLVDVVKPHLATLTPLWLSSLREFARLRFEPDISMSMRPNLSSDSLEVIYSALSRETLLKFYQDSWLDLMHAIASLVEQDMEFVFSALDGETESDNASVTATSNDINYRDEPVAFFFVLFGIVFEALVGRSGMESSNPKNQIFAILAALKKILRPSVAGSAIYQDAVFSETMDLLDRLVLTEGLDVQSIIIEISRNLCAAHPSARQSNDHSSDNLSEDIDQMFELTRIIVLVLAGLIPKLGESGMQPRIKSSDEAATLIQLSMDALVDAAEVFPSVIKVDLHACIFHVFATILSTASCQASSAAQALPTFKRFIQGVTKDGAREGSFTVQQIRGCLERFLTIMEAAKSQDSDASRACVRHTLLASTILIAGGVNVIPPSDPVIKHFVDELMDCLLNPLFSPTAVNCIRSLLTTAPKNTSDRAVHRVLLPRILGHLLADSTTNDDEEPKENGVKPTASPDTADVVSRALVTYANAALKQAGLNASFMRLLIPTLLARASKLGPSSYRETAARLVELASADSQSFRAAVVSQDQGLNEEQKKFMERVIREGSASAQKADEKDQSDKHEAKGPSITLKMDFGGSA